MEENPFPGLIMSDFSRLDSAKGRSECPKCSRSRKFYCYTCFVPVNNVAELVPKVKLPIKIDIIKHKGECDGKSTSPHAAVLAPDDVTLYDYPCVPDYDQEKTILIFPGPTAVELHTLFTDIESKPPELSPSVEEDGKDDKSSIKSDNKNDNHASELIKPTDKHSSSINDSSDNVENKQYVDTCDSVKNEQSEAIILGTKRGLETSQKESELRPLKKTRRLSAPKFNKVVFIDSTWNQTTTIANDERLKDITKVEIKSRKTKFWRYQDGNPDEYLSTIEAIYYFLRDFHTYSIDSEYGGEYDNLLFFFCYMYHKIRGANQGGKHLKAYLNRQNKNK